MGNAQFAVLKSICFFIGFASPIYLVSLKLPVDNKWFLVSLLISLLVGYLTYRSRELQKKHREVQKKDDEADMP